MKLLTYVLSAVISLSCVPAFGQRTAAAVSGVVRDPSGAVIPGARVTAIQVSTGARTAVQTNASGFYVIPNLPPSGYRLLVEKVGFEAFEQTGITLVVGQAASVNVTLTLGKPTQRVTVSGQPPLVNTRTQTLSYAITPQFTEQLPLNGRNILQLTALAPDTSTFGGAGPTYANQAATDPASSAGFVTASGSSRENSTAFYLNGSLNMDTYTQ
ncbi:MAG: carboxypeptidase-like regulatory domain-containing protein, partial [Terriglobia bacterium]